MMNRMENSTGEIFDLSKKMLGVLSEELKGAETVTQKKVIMDEMYTILSRVNKTYSSTKRSFYINKMLNNIKNIFKK